MCRMWNIVDSTNSSRSIGGNILNIEIKSRGDIDAFNFDLCQIKDCYGPAERLYSSAEHTGIDVCLEHYFRLVKE
jgi:hypothetical protein